jgi:hypothetical protein
MASSLSKLFLGATMDLKLKFKSIELEMGDASDIEAAVLRFRFTAVNPGEIQVDCEWREATSLRPMHTRWHHEMRVEQTSGSTSADVSDWADRTARQLWKVFVGCDATSKRVRPIIDALYQLVPSIN